jgi:dTDP-4-dehydrorhamnose 3,5-epimerase
VYCPSGKVLDVVVDIRVGSPTFGVHAVMALDSGQPLAVYLAAGPVLVSLVEGSSVTYLLSSSYSPSRASASTRRLGPRPPSSTPARCAGRVARP